MAELQQQAQSQQAQAQQEQQAKQLEAQKQSILRQIMTPEARDRLANVKLANANLAASVENQLIRLAQSGRLQSQVTDAMLKEILQQMAPQEREISITYQRRE
ncbi:DNA-binding TFAR19-related protein [Thermoplasmatales archaeon BRNA1]|nr:DNA-binding TFAR19-related protein [Thermoplasmatales archaeon BRNA1]